MRVSIFPLERQGKRTWIVTAWKISVECSQVYVDGHAVEGPMELDYVAKIVPEKVESHEFNALTDSDNYKAEMTHIYTLAYLFVERLGEDFADYREGAFRVKVVKE